MPENLESEQAKLKVPAGRKSCGDLVVTASSTVQSAEPHGARDLGLGVPWRPLVHVGHKRSRERLAGPISPRALSESRFLALFDYYQHLSRIGAAECVANSIIML